MPTKQTHSSPASQGLQWTRKGECNNCGFCCLNMGQAPHVVPAAPDRDDRFFELHGYTRQPDGAFRKLVMIQTPCSEHVNDRCAIFESPDRPAICGSWPHAPSDVRNNPCSYWFEASLPNGDILRSGGEGSPFPGMTKNADPRPAVDAS